MVDVAFATCIAVVILAVFLERSDFGHFLNAQSADAAQWSKLTARSSTIQHRVGTYTVAKRAARTLFG